MTCHVHYINVINIPNQTEINEVWYQNTYNETFKYDSYHVDDYIDKKTRKNDIR